MTDFTQHDGCSALLDKDLPEEPQTEDEARLVLEAIQSTKGYMSESTRSFLHDAPPNAANEIHRGFEALRSEAGAFAKRYTPL